MSHKLNWKKKYFKFHKYSKIENKIIYNTIYSLKTWIREDHAQYYLTKMLDMFD